MKTDLWAKSSSDVGKEGESLYEHTMNVVYVARHICNFLPLGLNELRSLTQSALKIAALHDVGKAASGFQIVLRTKGKWGRRHEILSAAVAAHISPAITEEELFAILTHHKSIPNDFLREGERCLPSTELPFYSENPLFDQMVVELLANQESLRQLLLVLANEIGDRFDLDGDFCRVDGLGKLDLRWLGRLADEQPKIPVAQRRHASLLRGILISSDHLGSAHQTTLPNVPVLADYDAIAKRHELKGRPPFPFQKRTGKTKGNAILKAPTGSGKTAAILFWAAANQSDNGRLFYVLPHTASINAMYRRLQKIYCERAVGLLHHKNAAYLYRLMENDSLSRESARTAQDLAGLARELYYPIRVTTPHQILRVALQGKGWELGLAEFPNACFVFDEIHAFEPLLVGLTISTIKWLKTLGAKFLFASATLPLFLEKIIQKEIGVAKNQIVKPSKRSKEDAVVLGKKRHQVSVRDGSLLSDLNAIITELQAVQEPTLIICNHVATSQTVFREIRKIFDEDVCLLHARFNAEDRFKIETRITGNHPPKILVATQAIEVSLDLDYHRGYSEAAPADALGQRFGRINRYGARPPASVVVFAESSTEKSLYDENTTQATIALLQKLEKSSQPLSEQDLVRIVDEVYKDGYTGKSLEEYEKGLNNSFINNFEKNIIAGTHRPWIDDVIQGSDGQVEVLPGELKSEFIERQKKSGLLSRQLLVPIRIGQFHMLKSKGVLSRDDTLRELITSLKYSSTEGLDLSQQIDNIF